MVNKQNIKTKHNDPPLARHRPLPPKNSPPDRRRRDVVAGAPNATVSRGAERLYANSSAAPPLRAGRLNGSGPALLVPPLQQFDFMEQEVSERELQISGLQPFTVYRIDVHACNRQVRHCSAAEFVFSRTKPAGEDAPPARPGPRLRCTARGLSSKATYKKKKNICQKKGKQYISV